MSEIKTQKNITNCHTHIFTIDHVPNKFGKGILPWPFYHIVTIKLVKWYYNNLTSRGSRKFKRFKHRLKKFKFMIFALLKGTIVLWMIYVLLRFLITWIGKIVFNFFRIEGVLSSEFRELFYRYITLARYSTKYKDQARIYNYLTKNYPPHTKYAVLSMDMDYMEAGDARVPYLKQLEELRVIATKKKDLLAFIFADPRRINATSNLNGKSNYLSLLKSVLCKDVFRGIKMYPALGYYPFDRSLIEMYEFAQENEIPIMTHCIRGSVFYRGRKEKGWKHHPIIKYNVKEENQIPIPLPQKKNHDFTTNFTHPLNYECLLNPKLLSSFLGEEKDLSNLKICLAHFGGSDEWNKYKEDAWNNYNNNISPTSLEEYKKRRNTLNHGSKRTIWWNASWLSVIYDLMINYKNVYTDVSFILFNEELFPMLKYLLQDEKVMKKILFGTDYYVVAQKGLDKNLYQSLRSYLGEDMFNLIAIENPRAFLKTKFS